MKWTLFAAALTAVGALAAPAQAAAETTLFVAPGGNDNNPGTQGAPLATIQKAVGLVAAGGTIAVRGGTYALSTNITIAKSGTASAPITLTAYAGEKVVIDGEALPYTPGAVGSTIPAAQRGAVHMEASYWRISGLEIIHGPYGVYCANCNNNVFERLSTHDNYETGFQLQNSSAGNQIVNLDSYNNRDPRKNGESADGLGIKEGGGDGNGFKMGGSGGTGPAAAHTVTNSVAFGNAAHGFTDNGNTGALVFSRSTAYQNTKTGFDVDGGSTSRLTGNLAVANKTAVALGSSTASGNSWNLGGTWTLAGTDPSTITGPRNADGSIRSSNFLVPANGQSVGAKL
ncbi:right-handed parallel beta-helix repeat-containing protein [Paractinoplanes lichenicola]|uniref:Right-handed parallel beta-helix repeat-containing protein n=1 Tax=Paractinoplanes lichenicola TaxID=2802976 RepID=A0ABS1VHY2_9ACTN|nr:right-handed parallel beta-helix repeat-containing protein [Actinoplanes lichenicola]MBL7253066.1 right-handed parallel beta-helix repeat-containing protein [Actinoplanes lichenicola]